MSRLPTLTGEFVVGGDPELRFTPTGKAVASISLIATESKKTDSGWEDGESTPWITASLWDQQAELAAEHIRKGMRVLASGLLYVRKYEKRDGGEGQSMELKWATVAPIPTAPKSARSGGYADDPWTTPNTDGTTTQRIPNSDPWATASVQTDEPPF